MTPTQTSPPSVLFEIANVVMTHAEQGAVAALSVAETSHVLADLAAITARLPPLLEQLSRNLYIHETNDDKLQAPGPPSTTTLSPLTATRLALHEARNLAQTMAHTLNTAHLLTLPAADPPWSRPGQ